MNGTQLVNRNWQIPRRQVYVDFAGRSLWPKTNGVKIEWKLVGNSQARSKHFLARIELAQDRARQAKDLAEENLRKLQLPEGSLLESYDVKIEGVKKEPEPWWAKF